MRPPKNQQAGSGQSFEELDLFILGLGTEYPPFSLDVTALDILCERHYPKSPAMTKVLAINRYTGIDTRSAIGEANHPIANMAGPPTISELCSLFLSDGVPLAVSAARKALSEAHISPSEITHVVSTTCTNSANPGFDQYVCEQLGITQQVEKVLLHGIGCSGGLAAIRTAANLALGNSFRRKNARILVVALEISSTLVRSELDSINESQQTRIGVALFSDCASSLVLSNGIGGDNHSHAVYELLGWDHRIIPDTKEDLGFDVDPLGWKVVLSPRVPKLAGAVVPSVFKDLLSSLPCLPPNYQKPSDFDWALHPGGATILSGVERAMNITPEHMRASYDTYIKHGNSSSATIISVMDRLRHKDMDKMAPGAKVKDFVVACAFGPGIAVETCMLKRNLAYTREPIPPSGELTPPKTESEGSRSDVEGELDVDIAKVKAESETLDERLKSVHPEVKEQNQGLSELLDGVELD